MRRTKIVLAGAALLVLTMLLAEAGHARRGRWGGSTYVNVGDDARWAEEYQRAQQINAESDKKMGGLKNGVMSDVNRIQADTAKAQEDIKKVFTGSSK